MRTIRAHLSKAGEKRERGLVSAHPRLFVGIFQNCWTESFVSFLILFSWTGLRGEDKVEQSPQTLKIQEGDSLILNCSYTVSNFNGLQWYRQDPGKGPELLFVLYSVGDEKQKERLKATLLKKGSSLHIAAPKPEDSATYLCAVETQCSPGTCSLYTNPAAGALESGHLWCFPLLEEVVT